jgi:hypothetical protein
MTSAPQGSGNPRGPYAPSRERARFSSEFISALLRDFRQGGPAAIAKVRKYQPAAYMKICALLVPREMRVEPSQSLKSMSDEELDAAIAAVRQMLEDRAAEGAKVIEGAVETAALPAPAELEQPQRKRPNRVLDHADTAVGPKERRPRKRVPSPASA